MTPRMKNYKTSLALLLTTVLAAGAGCGDDETTGAGGSPATGGAGGTGGAGQGGAPQGGQGPGGGGNGGATGDTFTVSGSVSDLLSEGLELTLNGNETLIVDADGTFTFTAMLEDGASYDVTAVSPHGEDCALANASGTVAGANVDDVTVTCEPVLAPVYPAAADWNAYVDLDGSSACDASLAPSACLHGGEHRFVYVPGASSCAGVTATDALGAFDWTCDDSGVAVRVLTRRLAPGMHLSDLVDFTATSWRTNSVTVAVSGTDVLTTADEVWWSNPVASGNAGGDLSAASTVYLVDTDPQTAISLNADGVGLVIEPGTFVTATSTAAVISVTGDDFVWIEGGVKTNGIEAAIALDGARHAVLDAMNTGDAGNDGISIGNGSHGTEIRGGRVYGCGRHNVAVDASHDVWVSDLDVNSAAEAGLRISGSDGVRAFRIVSADNDRGIHATGGTELVVEDVLLTNNDNEGLLVTTPSSRIASLTSHNNDSHGVHLIGGDSAAVGITVANNGGFGLALAGAGSYVSNVVAMNNGLQGIVFDGGSGHNARNLGAFFNLIGIQLASSANVTFTGVVDVGDNLNDCDENPGTGISDACANTGSSTATISTGIEADDTFIGKSNGDVENGSDTNGTATEGGIVDWTSFSAGRHGGWGIDGGTFPAGTNLGHCDSGETCRIWSFFLNNSDDVAKNVNTAPSGDATGVLDGNTFLLDAVEVTGDGIGDDDTLCESNERCLFQPNTGHYQGHGLTQAVAFTDGTVTGVDFFRFTINGLIVLP